ncbi:DUF5993 family protein [Enterobacter sp. 22466]|uniref:DUF5993 family protein n=1 Tax=Enterobacter sp. 22466 TaxID=3453924 RepID=UPI003F83DEDA
MFLPFLLALSNTLVALFTVKKPIISYLLCITLIIVTLLSFWHHLTSPLNISL